jgi:hypothetical protein
MSKGNKRWLVGIGAAALVVAIVVAFGHRSPSDKERVQANRSPTTNGSRNDFPVNAGGGSGDASGAAAGNPGGASASSDTPSVAKQIENVMGQWRTGILGKDPDAVVSADAAFRNEPKKFLEALMTSAETDADDRVRAFSTRVLGKFVDPTCAPLFTRLLNDKSQYVRMNAAWGLGELANTPEGHAAAKPALHQLQRLVKRETAKDTREAASLAARRLM